MEGTLQFDKDNFLNEVLPLLYLSLKYQKQATEALENEEYNPKDDESFLYVNRLEDFILQDQE